MTCSSVSVSVTLEYVKEQKSDAELLELYRALIGVFS